MPNSAPCQIMHPLVLVGLGLGVGEGLGLGVGLGLGNQVAISTRGCIIWQGCRFRHNTGALMKRGLRTPLPSIHLANLRSLPNKTDELLLLSRTNKDFSNSAALCFTETWLNDAIPDSALHLPYFQLIRADRDTESTGKSRGGRT